MTAHPVQGDPFWKAVRPKGVPAHARLRPDLVTAQFYTTCFTGVVVLTSALRVRASAANSGSADVISEPSTTLISYGALAARLRDRRVGAARNCLR